MDEAAFTIENEDGDTIACLLNEAYAHHCIIMVHGFKGDKREHGTFDEAARRFAAEGYSVIRFDMRGWGESDYDPTEFTLSTEIEDLRTVFSYAQQKFDHIAVVGLSMGAFITVASRVPACAYALWSPALNMRELTRERYLPDRSWDDVLDGETSTITSPSGNTYTFSRELFEELQGFDYETPLRENDTPTLLVHGTEDDVVSQERSVEAIENMSCRRELVLLHGDHHLKPSLDRAVTETVQWFDKYCKQGGGA